MAKRTCYSEQPLLLGNAPGISGICLLPYNIFCIGLGTLCLGIAETFPADFTFTLPPTTGQSELKVHSFESSQVIANH